MDDFTYDQWAQLLADFFFDKAHAGEEILFAVDDRSLAEASGLNEDEAAKSLSRAVRTVVGPEWLLGELVRRVDRWRRNGASGPHPALPFLAFTVLAASRMGEHESIAAHNYYGPLRRLFDPNDREEGAPGSFTDHVTRLWIDLERWANEDLDGTRGRIFVRDPGFFHYVGLAIQHALVKSADLRQLDAFFRRIGLEPGEEVQSAELRRALALWTAGRPELWAQRLRRISTEPALAEFCEALLSREAGKWDGRPRDPRTGRPIGRIRLGISSLRHPNLSLFLQWDQRIPESIKIELPSGTTADLKQHHGWYEPHGVEGADLTRVLFEGLELHSDSCRFDFRAEQVYALAYEDGLGAWVSVDSMSYGDRYHLVVKRGVISEVLHFAHQESAAGVTLDEAASRLLPREWKLIKNVQLDARPRTSPPPSLASLVPAGSGPRIRLLGGLPIGPVQGCYLRGGEPALALSTLSETDHVLVERESSQETHRLRVADTTNREMPLWPYRLTPGAYRFRHGDSEVKLQIVDGIVEAAGPGAGNIHHNGRDSIEIVGTETSPEGRADRTPTTVPAPISGEYATIIGARPTEQLTVELPSWFATLVGFEMSWTTIDAWADFRPAWVIKRNLCGEYEASLLSEIEPQRAPMASTTRWGKLIASASLAENDSDTAISLWQRYRKAAGATT